MSIKVNQISKFYKKQKVLDRVSFHIQEGEIVGFLGVNGAGKSTTMKIVSSCIPPCSGSVQVAGFDTQIQPYQVRKNIGYLPEHNPLYLDMYVKEHLTYSAKIRNISLHRVTELIELIKISDQAHKKVGQLSKGYRQRVGLANALIHNPKVLILDEPTTGLDPHQLEVFRDLIKSFRKDKTVLLSTHIMQEVDSVCDRVLIIHKGKLLKDINLKEHSNESNVLVAEFNQPVKKRLLMQVSEVLRVDHISANTYKIYSHHIENTRSNISDFAYQNQLKIMSLQIKNNTLEEIFKQAIL